MWDLGSLTGDRTFFPCIARWILNKWTPREVPLPNLGLGMCRQELGLQSSCCLSGCMEGHGLPHLLQVRKLRSSLENHAGRESLPCLHWPHLEENMMADDRLCQVQKGSTHCACLQGVLCFLMRSMLLFFEGWERHLVLKSGSVRCPHFGLVSWASCAFM